MMMRQYQMDKPAMNVSTDKSTERKRIEAPHAYY